MRLAPWHKRRFLLHSCGKPLLGIELQGQNVHTSREVCRVEDDFRGAVGEQRPGGQEAVASRWWWLDLEAVVVE